MATLLISNLAAANGNFLQNKVDYSIHGGFCINLRLFVLLQLINLTKSLKQKHKVVKSCLVGSVSLTSEVVSKKRVACTTRICVQGPPTRQVK